jgi:D-aminopeptidase
MTALSARLDRVLAALPDTPGPGGALAVLRDGEVLLAHSWGWADLERRLRFTPDTLFRICSISKQFTCATLLSHFPDPDALNNDLAAHLPLLPVRPTLRQMAHNQSGMRDYWATAMLCGAPVEGVFGPLEADRLIARTASLHFTPGTGYSYCNQNFRLIGKIVEQRKQRPLALLLRDIFDRAGMHSALLCPETSSMPDGTMGYEGSLEDGWRAAVNRIHWTGDAGIAASLTDMIAWEKFIDSQRDDPAALLTRMSQTPYFADGTEATYGFGLAHMHLLGRLAIGHGGGLRGWRSQRFYVPSERVSVVVLMNHMGEPRSLALDLLAAVFDAQARPRPSAPAADWTGLYRDPETNLVARVEITPEQKLGLWFAGAREALDEVDGQATGGGTTLARTQTGLSMTRRGENLTATLLAHTGPILPDIEGCFHNAEYDASLTILSAGGPLYGAFSGFLGVGMMQPLLPAGPDQWRFPMPRALDSSPPGDWTLKIERDGAGVITHVIVGCWLARNIHFIHTAGDTV